MKAAIKISQWKKSFASAILVGLVLLLGSCASSRPWVPAGFAVYHDLKCNGVCAVNPEGITWRVHQDKDQPKADIHFWKEAMQKRMTGAGYRILDSISFTNNAEPGWALVLTAPLGQVDYTYLVGAVIHGHELTVIEAAGTSTDFAKHRENMVAGLSKATSN